MLKCCRLVGFGRLQGMYGVLLAFHGECCALTYVCHRGVVGGGEVPVVIVVAVILLLVIMLLTTQ